MAILRTRATLRQIRAVDADAIKDVDGKKVLEVGVVSNATSHIKVKNATNNYPEIQAIGDGDDVNLMLKAKGDAVVAIGGNGVNNGVLEIMNTSFGGFQLKPNASTTNLYSLNLPAGLPGSDAFMKIDGSGQVTFNEGSPSSFTAVADSGSNQTIAADENFAFNGTANEIETSISGSGATAAITFGLPNTVFITTALSVPAVQTTGGSNILTFSGQNGTFAQDLTVSGDLTVQNLTVNGTTTTIHSTVLTVEDRDIVVASSAVTSTDANGAGILVTGDSEGSSYAAWLYKNSVSVEGGGSTEAWQSTLSINVSDSNANFLIGGRKLLDVQGAFFEDAGLGYGLKSDANKRARLDIKQDDDLLVDHSAVSTVGSVTVRDISLNSTGAGFGTENTLLQVYLNGILQRGVTVASVGTKLSSGSVDFAYELGASNTPKIYLPNAEVTNDDLLTVYYVV